MTTKEIGGLERRLEEMGMSFEYREFFVVLALEEKEQQEKEDDN